jgi:hypothetical protein
VKRFYNILFLGNFLGKKGIRGKKGVRYPFLSGTLFFQKEEGRGRRVSQVPFSFAPFLFARAGKGT